ASRTRAAPARRDQPRTRARLARPRTRGGAMNKKGFFASAASEKAGELEGARLRAPSNRRRFFALAIAASFALATAVAAAQEHHAAPPAAGEHGATAAHE